MFMIGGKCACFRAKMVEISGHLPSSEMKKLANDGGVMSSFLPTEFDNGTPADAALEQGSGYPRQLVQRCLVNHGIE